MHPTWKSATAEAREHGFSVMRARYPGTCIDCGKPISPRQMIALDDAPGARHVACAVNRDPDD